jgi:hypothetical protein
MLLVIVFILLFDLLAELCKVVCLLAATDRDVGRGGNGNSSFTFTSFLAELFELCEGDVE